MLKKLRNLALIFACMSLIFAGVSCSSSDDDDDDGKTTEQESGPDAGGNNGDGNNGSGGGSGSGSTGSGSGSGSTEEKSPYVGTWTGNVTIEGQACSLSATLNDDETLVAYLSMEGFTDGTWSETDSGVSLTIGKETVSGKLDNGNLVVNYGQDIPLTKVDTTDYVGTWKGTLGGATLSIKLNADGTMSGYSPIMDPTNIDGFWIGTNDGVMIGADVGDEDPEEGIIPGSLQGDKLVINFKGQIELTKDSSSSGGSSSGNEGGGESISESKASVENLSYDSDNLNNKIFRRVDGDGDIKYHLFKDGKCYESSSSETFSKEDDDDPIIISYKDKFYRLDPSKVCNRTSGNGLFATFTAGNGVTITLKSDGTGSASGAEFNFTNANGEITLSIFPSWKVLYDGSKLFLIMDPDNNELIFVKNHN
ncbi:MAG: hypothetical protein J6J11_02325 [Treponema sp.]|nr:hypothetical protein [Treponema sp.]